MPPAVKELAAELLLSTRESSQRMADLVPGRRRSAGAAADGLQKRQVRGFADGAT
jgi:hypothetical protein